MLTLFVADALQRIDEFLASSNLDACFPVTASSAAFGHDNHSRWLADEEASWSLYGYGPYSL